MATIRHLSHNREELVDAVGTCCTNGQLKESGEWRSADPAKRPSLNGLVYLCSRRRNLGVLLISKRFYCEASKIFWAYNTFSFSITSRFSDFIETLSTGSRDLITRISILRNRGPIRERLETLKLCKGIPHLELGGMFLGSWYIPYYLDTIGTVSGSQRVTFTLAEDVDIPPEKCHESYSDNITPDSTPSTDSVWHVCRTRRENRRALDPLKPITITEQ